MFSAYHQKYSSATPKKDIDFAIGDEHSNTFTDVAHQFAVRDPAAAPTVSSKRGLRLVSTRTVDNVFKSLCKHDPNPFVVRVRH